MAQPDRPALTLASAPPPGWLRRYQVMAWVVGTALVLLVLVAVPLKYAADWPVGVAVLGPIHGFLYIAYLATVIDLSRHLRLRPLQLVAMVAAGLVPFMTFVVEHRVVEGLRRWHTVGQIGELGGER